MESCYYLQLPLDGHGNSSGAKSGTYPSLLLHRALPMMIILFLPITHPRPEYYNTKLPNSQSLVTQLIFPEEHRRTQDKVAQASVKSVKIL